MPKSELPYGVTKRVFVALEIPPSCAETLVSLDPGVAGVRWLNEEELHLPLSLQWHVNAEEEERLSEALRQVHLPPFFLPLQGIGVFGKPPAMAVSVGIGKGHPSFFALHRHIQDAVLHAQLEPDLKPFHPHVTIARAKETPKGKFQSFLKEHAETEFCMWKVSSFALFSKEEAFGDITYSVEMRFSGT